MKLMICSICKREINFYGWASHVSMHKRKLGEDCFRVIKISKRSGKKLPFREQMQL